MHGTVDANYPTLGTQHWTAGCHGSVGFLSAVLRAVNIPVQPVWVCGHELAYFITEGLYLDHGDGPYNLNVKNSPSPINSLLIDEATYELWFTTDLTVNITDNNSRRAQMSVVKPLSGSSDPCPWPPRGDRASSLTAGFYEPDASCRL